MKRFSCDELVELVTAYLDDELDESVRCRFEEHLTCCQGCERYVGQFRITVAALGELPPEASGDAHERPLGLPGAIRDRLLSTFRERQVS
ncbi:anti-sigma factor family protein [Streptosporangium sp. NPDC000396]|uniref:anti-sigma factor family protein n=1 Tax=Streptosporangium sp. NPDC000396 TaxID=3366185 RepID=UPI0036BEBBBD